ncbi:hypothetical protein AB4Z48_31860 [Cupriavidus sp. 2TAF22]|uniref:hypothetical protein n=1 Tax=unclassified Cupriavidus TaxID=2640874 RepID=UPI003F8E4156
MKKLAALLLLCLTLPAIAAPVTLRPMDGERQVLAEQATNFTGACGGAVVRVMGVTSTSGNHFGIDLDAGVVIVRQAGKEIALRDPLSDQNAIACVPTAIGDRLLIASACAGSSCPDNFTYYVIDPRRLLILVPRKAAETCDERCAERVLGVKVPASARR